MRGLQSLGSRLLYSLSRGRGDFLSICRVASPDDNAVDLRHSLMRASDVKGCIHELLKQDKP